MRSRVLAIVGVSAAVLALAGCGSEMTGTPSAASGAPAPSQSSSAPDTSGSAPSSSNDSSGGAANTAAGGFTQQGTKLKLGEKAIVPFKSEGKTGAIGVTVKSIDKGVEADLAPLDLGDKAKGMTPYYVRVTVSNESGTDFSYTSLGLMNALLPDGSEAQGVSVIGTFDKCDSGDAGKAFTTKGATYDSCVLAVAQAGTTVTGASYNEGEYTDQAPGTDYGSKPITWQS
ncbi:hypothetical protein VSH64_34120 [Amycolatopsis rhabdoformis]|uniref:DUF4352 domain-containing protein n=1 Tax=Amycolatopsis rhabdoformis TaxID=1448059 RepID=A0ABZ1I0D9_9PSEU|nr:hypothetical protein [Amycolatopsis rhabdoformis]WSE27856.1 hypothetical protein VSH64_34120 [Amycolatopsis rhabdoformis]